MYNKKLILLFALILFLSIGCKESLTKVEVVTPNKNTLNNPDLGVGDPLNDYWYHLNDEGIEAQFLYYNARITRGANTINNPTQLNSYLDTLNFRTFPYYTVQVDGASDTISYMLGLTDNKSADAYYVKYSKLYPLDETNTSRQNWCNEMLVEYEGVCPSQVEVDFDYQFSATGTGQIIQDTISSPAVYDSIKSTKEVTFSVGWNNIDSLVWEKQNKRYGVVTGTSNVLKATLCAGNCDSSSTDPTYVIRKLKIISDPDSIYEADRFDSLIYVGIIDTNRYHVNSLMLIDRTEWDRHDSIYYSSSSKTLSLDTTFTYKKIEVPANSPMFRINTDCNQNLKRDPAEFYADYGADWCPDSLETGDDTFTDLNDNGVWDENEELVIDWNNNNIWNQGLCEVVDTDIPGMDGYGDIFDEVPCSCLGDWRETVGGVANPNYEGPVINLNWLAGSSKDPNGDNWRDCGWDGKCPGDDGYSIPDPNGTENNGKWDQNEGFEENNPTLYNYDILTGTGDYFDDIGNTFPNEPAEFCVKGTDGICDGNDSFEDRNCNGKWDDEESGDEGNGIWDDAEAFIDEDNDGIWNDGDGNWREAEPLYILSDRMETFIVDYSDPSNPVPVTDLDSLSSVTLMYGTYGPTSTDDDSVHLVYDDFITEVSIAAEYSESFYDIDSIVTKYTNKIIESPLPGDTDDYHITKTRWYQEENAVPSYGYDYHLFKASGSGYDIIKMVHPEYYYYYGYYMTFDEIEENFWKTVLAKEETYIYTYDGYLRDGEYYYQDTTMITDVADYYIQNLYEVSYDPYVEIPFKQVRYDVTDTGETECRAATDDTSHIYVDVVVAPPYNCPPADTILTNTYKITRTKIMTMIGSGVEFGMRNTIWLGSAGSGDPLGIVKDQLEIRWSEPYWKEYGSGWKEISRLELSSLRKTGSELSSFMRIFQPIQHLSLHKLVDEEKFDNEPYVVNSSYGIHSLGPPNEK